MSVCVCACSKPVKRGELLARIKAHLRVKSDATWVQSIVKGVLTEDSEAMKILESILPESIISRIQVGPGVVVCFHVCFHSPVVVDIVIVVSKMVEWDWRKDL